MTIFRTIFLFILMAAQPVTAATHTFDIVLDRVEGDGEVEGIGFFSTQVSGALGTGRATIDETEADFATAVERSLYGASLIGGSAGSMFDPTLVQDGLAGTVTISGNLGGLTGLFPEFISARRFEFVYSGNAFLVPMATAVELDTFFSTAEMSGFFSGTFISTTDDTLGYTQSVYFDSVSEVPIPGAMLLLLTALGATLFGRRFI